MRSLNFQTFMQQSPALSEKEITSLIETLNEAL